MVKEAEQYKAGDEEFKKMAKAKNALQIISNKKKTKDAIEKAHVWINANSNAKFDELMSKMEELESVLNPIVLNIKVARDTRKRMKENMISKLSAPDGDVSGMASTVAILSDILEVL
ncbi:heat shock cognate 70 kDa protein 2-like [Senna tora]|uniref:Heat shock cognate 70 kDa protein 2-like n=1 Tax=Senna tora TaxID=362788 RepID=A0A834XBX2_9FABA|nr:heat shock cognate 70 kDa protein 2-like [Senna tora]